VRRCSRTEKKRKPGDVGDENKTVKSNVFKPGQEPMWEESTAEARPFIKRKLEKGRHTMPGRRKKTGPKSSWNQAKTSGESIIWRGCE